MKTKESEIFAFDLKNVALLWVPSHLGRKLASLDVVELLHTPPRRQYAVEQILNAHSHFYSTPLMLILSLGAAPF